MKSIFIISTGLLIGISACKNSETVQEGTENKVNIADSNLVKLTSEQVKSAGIVLGVPEEREMHTRIKVNGVVAVLPQGKVSVSVPLGGYIQETALIPGAKVNKGGILATLQDQQYIQLQQDYLAAKSRLQYMETDYTRQLQLNETKASSDKVLQQAKSDFNGQKVLVSALAEKLRLIGIVPESLNGSNISRNINIYSPINGYVTQVNVNIGKYVNPTDVLFELVNTDELHLELTVFENEAALLDIGQKVTCTTNGKPDMSYTGSIYLITPRIGEDRSTHVYCRLDKYTGLLPGTYINAEIQLSNTKVTAVPEDAVVKWEGRCYIFTEDMPGQYRMEPVTVGNADKGYIEVRSALPAKKIVVKNAYTLLMKMKNGGENE